MELTKEKLNELKELAGRATPGPWYVAKPLDGLLLIRSVAMEKKLCSRRALLRAANTASAEYAKADLRYAAAASPDVVMALIERIERLEKEADWLAEMLETYGFNEEAPKPHNLKFWRNAARLSVESE